MKIRALVAPIAVAIAVSALAGCSAGPTGGVTFATDAPGTANVRIVASTDVWGSIAAAVGGTDVAVTSIINSPAQDPHEYEADARDQLAVSKAQLIVENGGGYDDFMDRMTSAVGTGATILNAADLSGYDQHPASGGFNEHLWYDFPTVGKVADAIANALARLDPGRAADYAANAAAFDTALGRLEATAAQLKAQYAGTPAAITESVPLYLFGAIGLVNKTPAEFSAAVEQGSGVAPSVLQQTLALFDQRKVKLLAYNEQTTGPETQAVLAAASRDGIPIVAVRETLPSGKDYLAWMTGDLAAIGTALGQ
ncbi:zinc ABC transporter substrate-binding protein [Gryllotalpicola sp.]|uniref:metal ABC transporter solute-binding protein, Zn/Mn family n=1 Tax=Gryllotalpicola sp. TaxID=1932787 RepID=UPI002621747D|nr:zinc ABC transporter substrate-binding protein [Gryllotalpicola sp.]